VARHVLPERMQQVPGRDAREDRNDGQHEERERHRRGDGEEGRESSSHFGRPKPAAASSLRPRLDVTFFTNARAAAACELALTTAISYRIGGCAQAGSATLRVRDATGRASVR